MYIELLIIWLAIAEGWDLYHQQNPETHTINPKNARESNQRKVTSLHYSNGITPIQHDKQEKTFNITQFMWSSDELQQAATKDQM
jgi:hypothetical protein